MLAYQVKEGHKMADIWGAARQKIGNWADTLGTTFGLPETGLSEKIAGGPTVNTAQNIARASEPAPSSSGGFIGPVYNGPQPAPTPAGTKPPAGTPNPAPAPSNTNQIVDNAAADQQAAAERAAESRRQAALGRYNAMKGIAETAKTSAKGEYDWLVDTLGSNKKDSLEQVALNREQGEADYAQQEKKTRTDYDAAKQQILTTYRDLQTQQEKIMRGSGMGQSSRSQEAQLKLNNLLGKDLSSVTTNEADSLALIGNALGYFQKQINLTNNQIETESKSKLDKAALDYDKQVKSIDANLTLSAAEREDAYASAEEQLAKDSQGITQWAVGLKAQAAEAQSNNKTSVDNLIADMLDENGKLNTSLDEKRTLVNDIISQDGFSKLQLNPASSGNEPLVGVYQALKEFTTKEELDKALSEGKISQGDYNSKLASVQMKSNPTGGTVNGTPMSLASANTQTNPQGVSAQRDPLLSALFA